jgi:hypothetical protein
MEATPGGGIDAVPVRMTPKEATVSDDDLVEDAERAVEWDDDDSREPAVT